MDSTPTRWLCCCLQSSCGRRCSASGPTSWGRRIRSTPRLKRCLETKAGTECQEHTPLGRTGRQKLGQTRLMPECGCSAPGSKDPLQQNLHKMLFSQLRAYVSHSVMLCASGISSPPAVPEITFSKVLRDHAKQESVCALSQLTAGKRASKPMRNPEMVGSLPRVLVAQPGKQRALQGRLRVSCQ